MRCAIARVSSFVPAAVAAVLCLPILTEEPTGVAAAGAGRLQPLHHAP